MANRQPIFDSGAVGLTSVASVIYSGLIARPIGPVLIRAINSGNQPAVIELAYGMDGSTWDVMPIPDLNGPDGTSGLGTGTSTWADLPVVRPDYVRFRAKTATGTTTLQLQIYPADLVEPDGRRNLRAF